MCLCYYLFDLLEIGLDASRRPKIVLQYCVKKFEFINFPNPPNIHQLNFRCIINFTVLDATSRHGEIYDIKLQQLGSFEAHFPLHFIATKWFSDPTFTFHGNFFIRCINHVRCSRVSWLLLSPSAASIGTPPFIEVDIVVYSGDIIIYQFTNCSKSSNKKCNIVFLI